MRNKLNIKDIFGKTITVLDTIPDDIEAPIHSLENCILRNVDLSFHNLEGCNSETIPLTEMTVYNNTMVNCGWRRSKNKKGGSVWVEKAAKPVFVNNLIYDCRYGLKQPKPELYPQMMPPQSAGFLVSEVKVTGFSAVPMQ